MNPSAQQIEARTIGSQNKTVAFLSNHHLIALIIFILAIVTANIWAEAIIKLVADIFGVRREDLKLWMWLLFAIIFTIIAYIIIVHIIRVPLTAAFTF